MFITIKNLTNVNFAKYGTVFEFDPQGDPRFQVKVSEPDDTGWRVALLKVTSKTIDKVSCHPNTLETFEPVTGVAVLVVAEHDKPQDLETFLLDRPVCVNKSVWHNLIAFSESALVKVTENLQVQSETYEIGSEINIVVTRAKVESTC